MTRRPVTLYDPDGAEIGKPLAEALEILGCSRALVYKISEPVEGGRKLTRWPKRYGQRGPDKRKRKQRYDTWEPTL
jgi:hypothetical protein